MATRQQEATINPDGSATFETLHDTPPQFEPVEEETFEEKVADVVTSSIDPALYLLAALLLLASLWYFLVYKKNKTSTNQDDYFTNLDGEKFNLKLPAEVDEYYDIKAKCEQAGWKPNTPAPANPAQAGPHRTLAQALIKRAIADIPIVQHIQKEAAGMNKLYSQSMCSVKQWRSYQAAENLVSAEVEEVRAEADEIEQGWSQGIWKQAMQYHQMLKQKQEAEAKAAEEHARKRKEVEARVAAARGKSKEELEREKELAAEKAAEELLKQEEKEKTKKPASTSSKSGSGGLKKGFLEGKGKKK